MDDRRMVLVREPDSFLGYRPVGLPGNMFFLSEMDNDACRRWLNSMIGAGVMVFESFGDLEAVSQSPGRGNSYENGMSFWLQVEPDKRLDEANAFFANPANRPKLFRRMIRFNPPIEWPDRVKAWFGSAATGDEFEATRFACNLRLRQQVHIVGPDDIRYSALVRNATGFGRYSLATKLPRAWQQPDQPEAEIEALLIAGVPVFETKADFDLACPDTPEERMLAGMQDWFQQARSSWPPETAHFFADAENKARSFDWWLRAAPPIEWPDAVKQYFTGRPEPE